MDQIQYDEVRVQIEYEIRIRIIYELNTNQMNSIKYEQNPQQCTTRTYAH